MNYKDFKEFRGGFNSRHNFFDGFFKKAYEDSAYLVSDYKKSVPEIIIKKSSSFGNFKIEILGEETVIERDEFGEMLRALDIDDMNEFRERFVEVCNYFILQAQYIQFEEVKNG